MGRKFRLAGALLAVVFAAAACDDESPTDPGGTEGDPLTEEEAVELAVVIMSAGYEAFVQPPELEGSPSAVIGPQETGSFQFEATSGCELDGTRLVEVDLEWATSEDGDTATIAMSGTETHDDCTLSFGEDGTIVLNGNPNLTMGANLAFADGFPHGEQTFSYGGGFAWTAGDRSGECGVDIDASIEVEVQGQQVRRFTQTVSGSFCGHDVEQEITVTMN